jgi:uncharacterized protein YuzE
MFLKEHDIIKEVVPMQIKYSPESDILLIKLKDGKVVDSKDIAECIIVHYSSKKEPLELEILDASKVAQLSDVDVSLKELLPMPA